MISEMKIHPLVKSLQLHTLITKNKLNWLNAVFAYNPDGDQVNLANEPMMTNLKTS